MKYLIFFSALVVLAAAFPQKDGARLTDDAITQVRQSNLIPQDATIQDVKEGITLGVYESIPINQRVDLVSILGDHVPLDVIRNLQPQIDGIGRN